MSWATEHSERLRLEAVVRDYRLLARAIVAGRADWLSRAHARLKRHGENYARLAAQAAPDE